jgi:hypothetical protein
VLENIAAIFAFIPDDILSDGALKVGGKIRNVGDRVAKVFES